ncbi:GGDEF domain-containing protein [Vibrio fluminensis]|uniref:GGDEF domain-containing protein n=1 Tax=Vibrio fluminensis TaxID=2783614 RepID=UPI001888AF9C|nr:GGDEF domain-containing protein [Vibrio fluminensis]
MDIDVVRQCARIRVYLAQHVEDLDLNDICYAFDVLCYLLSNSSTPNKLVDQSHITNRTIDKKIDILHHTARFAFNLDLDKQTYQKIGLRYIELIDFNTSIMKDFSIKDNLTGAFCYDYLKSLAGRLSKQNFLLFFFDLDNLKKLNDTQGHEAGNLTLKAFSKVLLASVRVNDLVFRYGGDEFVIILLNNYIEPTQLIARIDAQLNDEIQYSVGWAHNKDLDLFKTIKTADSLMYKNKRRTR